ncbi:MAG: peptide chain release factor-like protein [Nitrospirae bacterium]|nr:MAG: peptide chain release factor-like protein [Nitrospirota bacterium]
MAAIGPEKLKALKERLDSLGIKEQDLKEEFVRSGGHGGQNVNKRSTCVYLKHLPTGIEIKCQRTRSQNLNRYYARKELADRIEQLLLGRKSQRERLIEKKRKQKLKRKKRARLKHHGTT